MKGYQEDKSRSKDFLLPFFRREREREKKSVQDRSKRSFLLSRKKGKREKYVLKLLMLLCDSDMPPTTSKRATVVKYEGKKEKNFFNPEFIEEKKRRLGLLRLRRHALGATPC